MSVSKFLGGAAVAAGLAIAAGAAAAATVQPSYQSASTGTLQNGTDSALWSFGTIWDGRRRGDRLHGHSTVRITGSDACSTVAAGSECLFASIAYFNAVNLGAGTGNLDRATAGMAHAGLGLEVALQLTVDRTSNRRCAALRYGCPDQFTVAFTTPMDGFRVVGSGAWVREDRDHLLQIFWTRPAAPPPEPEEPISPVPVPASGLMLGALALAGAAAARRRKAR